MTDELATVDPLQERKIARRFRLIDRDGNGYIERADYEHMVDELCAAYGVDSSSEQASRLRERYLNLFRALLRRADSDGDGRISAEEFRDSVAATIIVADNGFTRILEPLADAILDIADADGDNRLHAAELRCMLGAWGLSEADADQTFAHLDLDGNGYITRDELIQAVREFYCGADPDAPGNWLYGPI